MSKYKNKGSCKALIVTGCMAQRYKKEIQEEIPEVDAILGTNSYDKILDAVDEALAGHQMLDCADLVGLQRWIRPDSHHRTLRILKDRRRLQQTLPTCIIPSLQGNYRSFPMEKLVEQAQKLAEKGVKS